MRNNPCDPPDAEVKDVKDPMRAPGSPVKALALGLVTDLGGTLVAGIVFDLLYRVLWWTQGLDAEQVRAAEHEHSLGSAYFVIGTLLGLYFSYLGGHVCARVMRKSELLWGAVLAGLSMVLGAWSVLSIAPDTVDAWFVPVCILGVATTLAGALRGRAKNQADSQSAA